MAWRRCGGYLAMEAPLDPWRRSSDPLRSLRPRPFFGTLQALRSLSALVGTNHHATTSKHKDEYTAKSNAADPENSGQQELDAKVLYDVSGGMRHGRVAIGHGAVKKAKVLSAAKEKTVASPNSAPSRHMAKENQRLRHANRCLHERVDQLGELTNDLILNLYSDLGKEVPASLKSRLAALTTNLPTSSSHVGEDTEDEELDGDELDGEDLDGEDLDGEDKEDEYNGEYREDEDLDGDDLDGEGMNWKYREDEDMDGEDMNWKYREDEDLDDELEGL